MSMCVTRTLLYSLVVTFGCCRSQTIRSYGPWLDGVRDGAAVATGPGIRIEAPEEYVRINYNNIPGIGRLPIPNLGLNPNDPDAKFAFAPGGELFGDRGNPVPPLNIAQPLPLHVARPLPLVSGGFTDIKEIQGPFALPESRLSPKEGVYKSNALPLSIAQPLSTSLQQALVASRGQQALASRQGLLPGDLGLPVVARPLPINLPNSFPLYLRCASWPCK